MATDPTSSAPEGTLDRTSAPVRDLPYYNGLPVAVSGRQWLKIVGACLLAFVVFLFFPPLGGPVIDQWVRGIIFAAIPLFAFSRVVPGGWTAIFRRLRWIDAAWIVGFAALNLGVVIAVAAPLAKAVGAQSNSATSLVAELSTGERVAWFLGLVPQLLGEELITILPMLALFSVLVRRLGWSRRSALITAWLVTSLMFGVLHLPAYGFNIIQCLLFIGVARVILTLAYVVTKNIWVSTGAHILHDWVTFALPLIGSAALIAF